MIGCVVIENLQEIEHMRTKLTFWITRYLAGFYIFSRSDFTNCEVWNQPYPHRECVDILVQLIEECDALDDHVVRSVHVELHLGSGVRVAETQLGNRRCLAGEALHQLGEVVADTWQANKITLISNRCWCFSTNNTPEKVNLTLEEIPKLQTTVHFKSFKV